MFHVKHDKLFTKYLDCLKEWNTNINLVQENTLNDFFYRHIEDSLQIQKFLNKDDCIIDIGAGAGFPGAVLSICGFDNVILCEKSTKKCAFLYDLKEKLELSYKIFNNDIVSLKTPSGTCSDLVVVARAFGELKKLLDIMSCLGVSRGVFHKGKNFKNEIEKAKMAFNFDCRIEQSTTNLDGVILIVNNVRKRDGDNNFDS